MKTLKSRIVSADLTRKLAQWRPVRMRFDLAQLNGREQQMLMKLVEASRYFEDIYWRQSDPEGLQLYRSLALSNKPADLQLRQMLMINGSRFDLLDGNRPFVGNDPMPPGRGLYPAGLTRGEIEDYVRAHPGEKDAIYSPYTLIRMRAGRLVAIPYHEAYVVFLEPAAQALRDAAAVSEDRQFANFLRLRADALLTDDYYASDLAWLDLKDPKFDVILAPYETYLDDVLGVKTSYGAAVLVRNQAESDKLAVFRKYVPDLQDALPLAPEDKPSKRGHLSPMEVVDSPFRAGDLRHGYQAVADNLPNDPRIHQQKGSKKIFFKNFMDARVQYVILPLAKLLMDPRQAARVSGEGYLAGTLLHEISHGLGPAYARQGGRQVDIREAIGPVYSGLEEAKADVVGMFGLKWLLDRGALPAERSEEYYASYLAGLLRTLRFGTAEAHGQAEIMEFNYLSQERAIVRDPSSGRYAADFARMPDAIARLAAILLDIEAKGDRKRAEEWFHRYRAVPDELRAALRSTDSVPVDIDPIFPFPERVW